MSESSPKRPARTRKAKAAAAVGTVAQGPQQVVVLPSNAALPNKGGVVRTGPHTLGLLRHREEVGLRARERVRTSRYLQEEFPFAFYLTHTLPEEAVGRGIGLKSVSRNKEFATAATELFRRWAEAEAVDLRKEGNFYSLQPLWLSTILSDGEVFVQKVAADTAEAMAWSLSDSTRRRLQLQSFERDQLATGAAAAGERWVDGVKVNGLGQAEAYRVVTADGGAREVPAAFMKHLKRAVWLNQVHGIPWMFCGSSRLLDALDIEAVRKHAAKIKSAFLGATVTQDGAMPASMRGLQTKGQSGTPAADDGRRYFEIFGGAVMVPLAFGEDVKFFQAQETMNYGQFLEELISPMVWSFGYPAEYIFSPKLTGPSQRAVLSKVARAHERLRSLLHPLLKWVWEWVIGDAMVRGELSQFSGVSDWNAVDFVADPDPSIDLGRDEQADAKRLDNNTLTVEEYIERRTGGSGVAVRQARILEKLEDMRFAREQARAMGLPEDLAMLRAVPPTELSAMAAAVNALEQTAPEPTQEPVE